MFITPAFAQSADGGGEPNIFAQMLPLVLIVVLFYFLLIRPQQKRAKEHKQVLSQLQVGDEVITNSGIMGKVTAVDGQIVTLNLGATQVKFQKQSVQAVLPAGTLDGDGKKSEAKSKK